MLPRSFTTMNKRKKFSESLLRSCPFQLLPNVVHPAESLEKCLFWQESFIKNLPLATPSFEIHLEEEDELQLESLRVQSYQNYFYSFGTSLNCEADYLIRLPKGVLLHPEALFIFAKEIIKANPELIYTNEVFLDSKLKTAQQFLRKQAPDAYTFLAWDYFGDCLVIKKEYASFCQTIENVKENSLTSEIKTSFIPLGIVHKTSAYHVNVKSKPKLSDPGGKIQVIVPFKNQAETTIACAKSLLEQTCFADLEIYLVNNNSDKEDLEKVETFAQCSEQFKLLNVDSYFNYALINNTAARESESPFILFLNNDVVLQNAEAVSELRSCCALEDVGVVGGKLLYPDGSVQHAGINFLPVRPANMHGEEFFSHIMREINAVTFAMALVKRKAYEEVDGLDEFFCPNGFGDTIFCNELKKIGWRTIFTPYAIATHHESKSRGAQPEELEWLEMVQLELPIPDFYADFTAENQPMSIALGGVRQSKLARFTKRVIKNVLFP